MTLLNIKTQISPKPGIAMDPVTGLDVVLPSAVSLRRSMSDWAQVATATTLEINTINDYVVRLEGSFAYKGKGAKRQVDWQRSTINAIEADPLQGEFQASDFKLNGATFVSLAGQSRLGDAVLRWLTQGNDIVTTGYFGSLVGGPGADIFTITMDNEWQTYGYRIGDFNAQEGDRIRIVPKGPSDGTWGVIRTVDLSLATVEYWYVDNSATLVIPDGLNPKTAISLRGLSDFDLSWISIG